MNAQYKTLTNTPNYYKIYGSLYASESSSSEFKPANIFDDLVATDEAGLGAGASFFATPVFFVGAVTNSSSPTVFSSRFYRYIRAVDINNEKEKTTVFWCLRDLGNIFVNIMFATFQE